MTHPLVYFLPIHQHAAKSMRTNFPIYIKRHNFQNHALGPLLYEGQNSAHTVQLLTTLWLICDVPVCICKLFTQLLSETSLFSC